MKPFKSHAACTKWVKAHAEGPVSCYVQPKWEAGRGKTYWSVLKFGGFHRWR